MKIRLLLLVTFLFAGRVFAQSDPGSLQVSTEAGILEGVREASGIRSFKGVPFAAPPVDTLRWREPQPPLPWKGVRRADRFGPRAVQPAIYSDMVFRSNGMSEDCLYLNIWAPTAAKGSLPVLVYFYGGGFMAGDGSEPRYDGESMATKGIVTVTVNYRLGIFGFFAHPELTAESPHRSSGNYGLLDQAAALKWVKQNIAAFGGDPNRITIAGESAGSISVSAQMASPMSRKLIAGAIGESGSLLGTLSPVPLGTAEETGVRFARSIGAGSLSELRKLSADSVLKASTKSGSPRFSLTIDGWFLPESPFAIFEKGEQAPVPLLAGWNNEEMNYRALLGSEAPTKENFAKAVQRLYGEKAADILAAYAPQTDADVEAVATALAGDRFIGYSTWKWIELHSRTAGPVYRYLYERARPATTAGGNGSKGAVHSAEIEYALGNLSTNTVFAWTDEDRAVSKTMQDYFANFIKRADPNGAGLPAWPAFNTAAPRQVMHINVQSKALPEQNADRYLLLDKTMKQ